MLRYNKKRSLGEKRKMKKVISLSLTFLFISTIFSQVSDLTLVKTINLGLDSLNYIQLYDNSILYTDKDYLILYDLKTQKEKKIRVKSEKSNNFDALITEFKVLPSKEIAVINNEPFLMIWNPTKETTSKFKYNIESNTKTTNQFWSSKIETIEELQISPLGSILVEKKHYQTQTLGGLLTLEEWYEYNFLSFPSLEKIFSLNTKEDFSDFNIDFSKRDSFVLLINALPRSKSLADLYGIVIKNFENQKSYNLFPNQRTISWDITKDDKLLAVSLESNLTKVINLNNFSEVLNFPITGNVSFSPKEDILIVEGNRTINLIDLTKKETINTYWGSHPCLSNNENILAYSLGENFLAPTKELSILYRDKNLQKKIKFDAEYFLEDISFTKDDTFLILLLSGNNGYKIMIYKV